jgi:carbon monoxide dehydrogenase subunit G
MELTNEFRVGVTPDEAWNVLTDVERIAPCMPGAELQEIAGDEYRGVVKVKVGPITAQYKGKATFVEKDDSARRAVLLAEGRETRGQGNATATIAATLTPDGDGTHVSVVTDLAVTGRVAQFGRGVLADVSAKLLDQFVNCLETNVLAAPAPAPASAAGNGDTGDAEAIRRGNRALLPRQSEVAPVDLLDAAGVPVAKRAIPIAAGVLLIVWWLRRRRHRGD